MLDSALRLFSRQGYGATSVRDIATAAGVSTGNLYHHFPDKESIFRTLLDEYREITASDSFPLHRVLHDGMFPENIEQLGYAARDSVRQYRAYQALIFVDVIEFEGTHIRGFYSDLARRFEELGEQRRARNDASPRVRPGVSESAAMHMVARLFVNYFQLEILFGVAEPFGRGSAEVVKEMADMLRNGIGRAD